MLFFLALSKHHAPQILLRSSWL